MELFGRLESQYGLPSGLLDAVWAQESSRGRAMLSPKGAKGHMGFMDATAQQYGVADPNNLTQAATGAARMYSDLLRQYGGDLPRALAAYNWGQGNLARKGFDAAPAETRNYIEEVTATMGQPQARASQQDAPSDEWTALNAQFAPGAKQGAQEPDPWAELGARFAQPAAATAGPARTQQPQQAAQAAQAGTDPVRRAANAAIPLVGPMLAAFDINPDVPAMVKGLAGGVADLGQTLMNRGTKVGADTIPTNPAVQWMLPENLRRSERGVSSLVTGQAPMSPAEQANAERSASLDSFYRDNAGNPWFTGGRVAGNVLATMPVGGAVAAPVRAAAPFLAPVADAIATGGFRTGLAPATLLGKAGNVALRGAGGAVTGGASAGLINPDEALLGAGIGGTLPPVIAGAGRASSLVGAGVRRFFTPQAATDARAILQAGDIVPADIPTVRAALQQQGPNIVGEGPTVSQILQNPEISQLERSVRNAPGGAPALIAKDQAQNAARLAVVNDIAPVAADLPAARTNFGNTIAPLAADARAAASKEVRQAFDAVDPFNETSFYLPLPEMEASKAKFLGPGTFGTGSKAQAAIDAATDVGTEVLPAITAVTAPGVRRQGQTIVDAIKSLGGIKQDSPGAQALAGEIADLKQAGGMRSIIQNGRGQSPDTLAQAMHAHGFIPDEDPATLLEVLKLHAKGDKVFSQGADRSNVFRAGMEAAQGEAPGAEVVRKTVPFRTVQNLRSSIGEAAEQARMRGANKEAAALDGMKADIDKRVNLVQIGQGDAAEHFPPDVVTQWRKAIDLHADKQDRFARGPQAGMFRKGGDGNYSVEGGELAPKFFSPRLSQAEDIESLKRMRLGDPVLDSLKSYATTDASRRVTGDGTLRSKAFNDWLDAHGGAIRGLFDEGERARLTGVGADLKRASDARDLGRATGSNTSQNVQNALGLGMLDSRAVNLLASRTPFVGRFTGPMLDALRESAKRGKAARIGGLLSDPAELDAAIAAYQRVLAAQAQQPALAGSTAFGPLLYRTAPVLAVGR